jgi:hypothetical protein
MGTDQVRTTLSFGSYFGIDFLCTVPGKVLNNPLPRKYLDIQHDNSTVAYPPRPIPGNNFFALVNSGLPEYVTGSIADMNIIMENCDFSRKKVSVPRSISVSPRAHIKVSWYATVWKFFA